MKDSRPVVESMRADRDALVIDVLATIQDGESAYTTFESTHEEDAWAETAAWLVDLFLELAEERRWLTSAEKEAIRSVGTVRRHQGFTFGALKTAVRVAVSAVRARVVREYEPARGTDRAEVDTHHALLDRFGHALEDFLLEGFEAGGDMRGSTNSNDSAALLQDVVDRRVLTGEELSRRADELGCETSGYRCLLITPDSSAADRVASSLARVHSARRSSGRLAHTVLVAPVPDVAWSTTLDNIRELADEAATTLLVCGPCSDLAALHDRYVCAISLVPYIGQLGEGRSVLVDSDFELVMVAAALPRDVRRAFLRIVLERPLASCDAETAERLRGYLAANIRLGFSAVALQQELCMHRSTVYRWRDDVTTALGRSLTAPDDQAILTLAHHAGWLDG